MDDYFINTLDSNKVFFFCHVDYLTIIVNVGGLERHSSSASPTLKSEGEVDRGGEGMK